jgi:hypothetical protein
MGITLRIINNLYLEFLRKKPNSWLAMLIICILGIFVSRNIYYVWSHSQVDLPPDPQAFLQFTNQVRLGDIPIESISASAGDKSIFIPWVIAHVSEFLGLSGVLSYLMINIFLFVLPSMVISFILLEGRNRNAGLILWASLMLSQPNWTYSYLYFFEAGQICFFLASLLLLQSKLNKFVVSALTPILILSSFLCKWQSFMAFLLIPTVVLIFELFKLMSGINRVKALLTMLTSLIICTLWFNEKFQYLYNLKVSLQMAFSDRPLTWKYGNNGGEFGASNLLLERLENFLHIFLWYHWGLVSILLVVSIFVCLSFPNQYKPIDFLTKVNIMFFLVGILFFVIFISWDPRYVVVPTFACIAITQRLLKNVIYDT